VEQVPEDPAERKVWLERWAAQQRRRHIGPHLARPYREKLPVRHRLRMGAALAVERQIDRLDSRLDRGLDTAPHVYDLPEITAVDGAVYVPTPWHVLPRALRTVRASREDVLVDFGCGKGRIVHQAAKRPLRRVIGIEINPQLAEFARTLVAAHRHAYRCEKIEIANANAAQFKVPDDVTIAFMFDPFRGPTMDDVLGNLITSFDRNPRRLALIYVYPTQGARVLATGRFRLVRWQRGGLRDFRMRRAAIFECC
jgi:SAM-dependent methyltransferase